MEGVFVYNRPEQVLEQYELEVKSVSKGREGYICDTSQGRKVLKEYRGSVERAQFLAEILGFLKNQGILVENVMRTKEGCPLAKDEEEQNYLLLDVFSGAECDAKSREDMLRAVRQLAKFHSVAMGYPGEVPEVLSTEKQAFLHLCEKHNRELGKVKNYIRSKKKKNEFEVLFAGKYDYFMGRANEVAQELRACEPEEEMMGFCHGDFNQHNLIFTPVGIAMVHLESMSYSIRIGDLANFIRKMLEKNNWNTGLGMDLIRAYDGVKKLSAKELKYLYLYLAYPEKFWKIANHYYNSHKAWLSGRNIEKLEKVIEQEHARSRFLEILFHFTG
jgi:CotS family spore coat protein